MHGAKSHIIVDFEQSFLRNPYPFSTYLPFFYQVAKEERRKWSTAQRFYHQYRNKTLTLDTVYRFLKEYEDDLYVELLLSAQSRPSAADEKYLRPSTLLDIDKALEEKMIALYYNLQTPLIIVTAHPYKHLITDYLNHTLPQGSFTVIYAPPLKPIEKAMSTIEVFTIMSHTESPPPGYSLIINSTRPEPEGGWQSYAAELEQRLLETGDFCDLRKEEAQKEQELREQEQKKQNEQELREREQKKQNEAVPPVIQEEWLVYSRRGSYTPSLFGSATKFSDENRAIMDSPTIRRVKKELSSSPSRTPSPSLLASPLRPASPAQHVPNNTNIFKRAN
jgi:hypothetical protein